MRRPIAKHLGSHGDGWVACEYALAALLERTHVLSGPAFYDEADVLADDWETQEPAVTITRVQLAVAFKAAFAARNYCGIGDFEDNLASKLGLGEP